MKRATAERMARLYPPAWRTRFGEEFVELLQAQPLGPALLWDVLRAAAAERLFNLSGLETAVATYPAEVLTLARRPSAFVPVLMSLAALAVVLAALASVGPVRQPDEGAAAHVFQLLVAGEAPVMGFFALRWIGRSTRAALTVMAVQALAVAAALFPVWYFGL